MSSFSGDARSIVTNSIFDNSILRITSASPENNHFGTGFVIKRDEASTYILTCAQVIEAVGGIDQVKVDNHTAIVISCCRDNPFNGLAILRVEQQLGDIILPLGESGVFNSHFIALGYQANATEIQLELTKGCLEGLVKPKRRRLHDGYIWKLNISNNSTLGAGFVGAPVIDSKSYTVLGVISQQEERSKDFQAISITALKRIWLDVPSNIIRNRVYDLDKVSNLLKFIFRDEDQLLNYFSNRFPIVFRNNDIPFLPRLYYLANYCNYQNELDDLLTSLEESFNQNPYYKAIDTSKTIQKPSKVTFYKKLRSKTFIYSIYLNFSTPFANKIVKQSISQCEITFVLNYSKCTNEILHAIVHALADSLELFRDEVRILDARSGSVIVKIEIPSNALDKLISAFENDRHSMRQLGISYVTETFNQRFILENIQILIDRSYTIEEIIVIYQEYFNSVQREELINTEKLKIIDSLIKRLNQESLISELLSTISKQKPDAYDKFSPYYKIPRRPSRENKIKTTPRITLCEKIKGGFSGTGIAFSGAIILSILDDLVSNSLHKEVYMFRSIFSTILWLCLTPLGSLVGIAVAKVIGRKVGDTTGRLAAAAFSIGTIGLPLGIMILLIIIEPPKSIWEIIKLLILPFFDPDHPFDSLWKFIGFNNGSRSAYQKAMD